MTSLREDHKGPGRGAAVDVGNAGIAANSGRRVVVSQRLGSKPIPVDEACGQLERSGDEFVAFIDAATHSMAVLYRRKDGSYGLIES